MSDDLAFMPATDLLRFYRKKKLSPVEATKAALRRIERHNGRVNAYNFVDEKGALASARESEKRWAKGRPRGRIDGVPTSIKDIVLIKGWTTLRGSETADQTTPAKEDAPAVARMREHGAVFLGKTTTPEFGWKGVTDSRLTGITHNPWKLGTTPGGSSGGASAAIAAGMGQLGLGTDGGGSIRIPASLAGIVGIKANFGRVPAYPASAFGNVAHVGPMARTVGDTALLLTVMAEPDARDWMSLPYDGVDFTKGLDKGIEGLRIAYSADLGYAEVDPEVAAICLAAARRFKALGAKLSFRHPGFEHPGPTFQTLWWGAAGALIGSLPADKQSLIDPGLREVAAAGRQITIERYHQAIVARNALGTVMRRFMTEVDLLLTPQLAVAAFPAGQLAPTMTSGAQWTDWTPFTYPFNLTQQPAMSVPCGFTKDGRPVGLQIVGPWYREDLVLRAARAYEREHSLAHRRPPLD